MTMRAIVAVLIVVLTRGARATPEVDKSAAEKLFDEGRELLATDHPDEACTKFEQSIRKDPRAIGTLLNLALCNERRGKTATALRLYQEALDRASEAQELPQAQAAKEKVLKLSPQVPIVTLVVASPSLAGAKLLVDDLIVGDVRELALDPGHHELVFAAPGRLPYQTAFDLERGERRELAVPALRLPATKLEIGQTGARLFGNIALYGGIGLLAIGSGFGVVGWRTYNAEFPDHCGPPLHPDFHGQTTCDASGQRATDRAREEGTVATVVGGIGLAALATGLFVVLRASPNEHHVVVATTGSRTDFGLVLTSSF